MVSLPILGERYQLRQRIGRGGMAFVYSAWDTRLLCEVAVKIIKPALSADGTICARFSREAAITCQLHHPNIMSIYNHGVADGLPYLVMPLIEGLSLKQLLQSGQLPNQQAVEIFMQTCDAIGYAHSKGVAHGDIKPANILVSPKNHVILTDFGLASITGEPPLPHPWGSLHYTAPEQAAGSPPTFRSDVYSLGVILHLLLAGVLPSGVYPLSSPTLPKEFQPVLTKALAKNPADRFSDAREMHADCVSASQPVAKPKSHPDG
jgi:serine/threonine-protein kinase